MCSTMKSVYLTSACVIWFCSFSFAFRTSNYNPSCRNHDKCIRLTECRPYMNVITRLRRPLTPTSLQYLRRQECGFDGAVPMVCCFNPGNVNAKFFGGVDYPIKNLPTLYMPQSDVQPAQTAHQPDFTPIDLGEYKGTERLTKDKSIVFPDTTTTEKTTSTTFFKKRVNKMWNLGQKIEDSVEIIEETKKEELLKNKIKAINQAFASMDYFFVRRMMESTNEKNSIR